MDVDTYIWTDLTPLQTPPARHFPSNVYSGNGNVIVFGGNSLSQGNNSGALNDLWTFNIDTQLWDTLPQNISKPLPRFGHTAIYIPSQDRMIIFGGQGTTSLYNDTWEYSGISTLGISNVSSLNSIHVYPNPVLDLLHITFNNSSNKKAELKITNVFGEKLLSKQIYDGENTIDLSTWNNGIYLVQVGNEFGIETSKIIVNK